MALCAIRSETRSAASGCSGSRRTAVAFRCIILPDQVGVQQGLQACVPVAPWDKTESTAQTKLPGRLLTGLLPHPIAVPLSDLTMLACVLQTATPSCLSLFFFNRGCEEDPTTFLVRAVKLSCSRIKTMSNSILSFTSFLSPLDYTCASKRMCTHKHDRTYF